MTFLMGELICKDGYPLYCLDDKISYLWGTTSLEVKTESFVGRVIDIDMNDNIDRKYLYYIVFLDYRDTETFQLYCFIYCSE